MQKITAKTIICSEGASASSYGQNAFFYDAAEGLLTSVILLIAEYCPPEKRHINFCVQADSGSSGAIPREEPEPVPVTYG